MNVSLMVGYVISFNFLILITLKKLITSKFKLYLNYLLTVELQIAMITDL